MESPLFETVCTFCNAIVVEPETRNRIDCPRCGESFVATTWAPSQATRPSVPDDKSTRGPRIALFVTLPLIFIAAVVGISQWKRSAFTTPSASALPSGPATTQPPMALEGLKYIPANSNIVFAVQPSAFAGFQSDPPRSVLLAAGVPASILAPLERAGLPAEQIDQIVIGLTVIPDRLIPPITIFVKSRRTVDLETLCTALQAEKKPKAGRAIYQTNLNGLVISPIDGQRLLLGLSDDDVAVKPMADTNHLSASLKDSITRLDPASYFWIATSEAKWHEANAMLMTMKPLSAKLAKAKSLSLGVSNSEEGSRLKCSIEVADATTANALEKYLQTRLDDKATITNEGTRINAASPQSIESIGKLVKSVVEDLQK